MANNKVQLANGLVLIDLTSDTVEPSKLLEGFTAHDCSGAAITGTYAGVNVVPLTVTNNGTFNPTTGTAYAPVVVNVPGGGQSYTDGDYLAYGSIDGNIVGLCQAGYAVI